MRRLTVDGLVQEAKAEERLIDILNRIGTRIPQVCYHPQLGPILAGQSQPRKGRHLHQHRETDSETASGIRADGRKPAGLANRAGHCQSSRGGVELQASLRDLSGNRFADSTVRWGELQGGILEVLRGALGSSDKVLEIVVEAIKTPELIRGIRNFLVLVKLLGTVEPELVEGLARSLAEALTLAKTYESKPPGFWRTELHQFRSRDLRRGLVFISSLLEAFGQELAPEKRRA